MARTLILAWVIGLLGLIMIGGGVWGVVDLFRQAVRAPLKSYGGATSMICGCVAMLGVAQALRFSFFFWRTDASSLAFVGERASSRTRQANVLKRRPPDFWWPKSS